jgi:serine/threonine-protein kinase RsbW
MPEDQIFEFRLDVTVLRELRERVEHFMEDLPLEPKRKMRMTLCVDEAAANIIEHCEAGEDSDHGIYFKMQMTCEGGFFRVIFMDDGRPFDPTKAPLVDIKSHIRSGNKGGLGVHIMRLNLDIFEYARRGQWNEFTLGMNLTPLNPPKDNNK